jgi:anthranilate phosphoribosyltransferase
MNSAPTDALRPLLADLALGRRPEDAALAAAFAALMDGHATPAQIGALLMGLAPFAADAGVLVAGASAMRARMTPVRAPKGAVDVCGTGGDGAKTLNVSTAVSFVLAGCGVPVAKHGNRAMSSRSGAADVLEALGVDIAAPLDRVERALAEANLAFLFAQTLHPAMRHVAAPRRELGFRTVFNVLGPLSNPAGVRRQLVGVFDPSWLAPLAEALGRLGAEAAYVVHGAGGLDEVSLQGETEVAALSNGAVRRFTLTPDEFGLPFTSVAAIAGGAPEDNARALSLLLEDAKTHPAYAAYVCANAGAALTVAGRSRTVREGVALACESLASGAAKAALDKLAAISRGAL